MFEPFLSRWAPSWRSSRAVRALAGVVFIASCSPTTETAPPGDGSGTGGPGASAPSADVPQAVAPSAVAPSAGQNPQTPGVQPTPAPDYTTAPSVTPPADTSPSSTVPTTGETSTTSTSLPPTPPADSSPSPAPSASGEVVVSGDGPTVPSGSSDVGSGMTGPAEVRLIGRFQDAGSEGMRFEWSGSGMVAAFEGTSVSVNLSDTGNNQFTVLIDGQIHSKLEAQSGTHRYELASGLPSGQHLVELYRRTEASFGTSSFLGFDFGDGHLLPAPAAQRRIEIIGDSISCGYGNEGDSPSCGFSAETENHYLTYGAIAARALNAEVVTIAWSGKGIVFNYDTDTTDPLPDLYPRTLPSDASSTWSFESEPDAVVINLGTNDYSTGDDPSPELFREHYVTFLEQLRQRYPSAFVLCTVGPLLNGEDLNAARAGIAAAVDARRATGDERVVAWEMNIGNPDPGCDYHPSVATHEAMAEAVAAELRTHLGW